MQCTVCHKNIAVWDPTYTSSPNLVVCGKCFLLLAAIDGNNGCVINEEKYGEAVIHREVAWKNSENMKHTMRCLCPACGAWITETFDLNVLPENSSVVCKSCGKAATVQIEISQYSDYCTCNYCGQSFHAKQVAEEHEIDCEFRKYIPRSGDGSD